MVNVVIFWSIRLTCSLFVPVGSRVRRSRLIELHWSIRVAFCGPLPLSFLSSESLFAVEKVIFRSIVPSMCLSRIDGVMLIIGLDMLIYISSMSR